MSARSQDQWQRAPGGRRATAHVHQTASDKGGWPSTAIGSPSTSLVCKTVEMYHWIMPKEVKVPTLANSWCGMVSLWGSIRGIITEGNQGRILKLFVISRIQSWRRIFDSLKSRSA
jgi:hypothetical protein